MLIVRTEPGSKERTKTLCCLTSPNQDDVIWTLWLSLIQKRVNKCEKVMATSGDTLEFWSKALSKYKRSCKREIKSNLFDLQNKQSARTWGFSHFWLLIFVQITPLLLALISLLTFVILVKLACKYLQARACFLLCWTKHSLHQVVWAA